MDAMRTQIVALTEELTTVKSELVNIKQAHANLHQQSSDSNTTTARNFAEQRTRLDVLESQAGSAPTGKGSDYKKPLIKPEQVVVNEFHGSMTDSRAKFFEWEEKLQDRVELYEDGLVRAMAEAQKRDGEITAEESIKLGVSPMASKQLHGF